MPALPPDVDDILTRLVREGDSKRLATVLGQNRSEESQTTYLHWDKLRYKQPPAELTADEWWLRIKWGRRAIAREVELLLSKEGRPLWYCLPDLVLESVDNISRRASGDI